jgi:hypothetical protein
MAEDVAAPVLSIVIPVRNRAPYLSGRLKALTAQAFGETWEVGAADNGSRKVTVSRFQSPSRRRLATSPGWRSSSTVVHRRVPRRSLLYLAADDVGAGTPQAMGSAQKLWPFLSCLD